MNDKSYFMWFKTAYASVLKELRCFGCVEQQCVFHAEKAALLVMQGIMWRCWQKGR